MRDLNTLSQLFAAIYITLAVDIQFFQRFWSQAYYHTVTDLISKYKFKNSTRLQDELTLDIKSQASTWEASSRKRGVLMFGFCFAVLVYASFEMPVGLGYSLEYIRLIPFSFFTLVVALCSHKLLKSWLTAIITGIVLLCLLSFPYQEHLASAFPQVTSCIVIEHAKIIVICTLGLPILWQLFSNWLYSNVYKRYLIELLNKEANDYNATLTAMKEKDSQKLPSAYMGVMASLQISKETNDDIQITEINKVLSNRLKYACKYPNFRTLLKYIPKKEIDITPINDEGLKDRLDFNEPVINAVNASKSSNPSPSANKIKSTRSPKTMLQQKKEATCMKQPMPRGK